VTADLPGERAQGTAVFGDLAGHNVGQQITHRTGTASVHAF
jgi:hypothetical protein